MEYPVASIICGKEYDTAYELSLGSLKENAGHGTMPKILRMEAETGTTPVPYCWEADLDKHPATAYTRGHHDATTQLREP